MPPHVPGNYQGSILVLDIDDTLRDSRYWPGRIANAPVIPGVADLVWKIARRGVPILYLTAASVSIRNDNVSFLRQLPRGWLWDVPLHGDQSDPCAFKSSALRRLRSAYPQAWICGIGDNTACDPEAYRLLDAAFIRSVVTTRRGDFRTYAEVTNTVQRAVLSRRHVMARPAPRGSVLRIPSAPGAVVGSTQARTGR